MNPKFEAGVRGIVAPHKIDWTGFTLRAADQDEATRKFIQRGFYRDLVVREVIDGQ